jgi:uncharacterized protein YdhG (YjbR/CyaY superfamily)
MVKFKSVDDYIALQPEDAAEALNQVRGAILKSLPNAEEIISYNMPAYKINEKVVLYFAGWKRHYSLYPAGPALVAEFKSELAPYEIDRGTIRLPYAQPVPVKLIERIARFRANESA